MVQHGKFGSTMSALGQKRTLRRSGRCPLYPQKRTLGLSRAMSASRQKRTLERRLFDYLVGTAKQRWRYGEAECFGSLEVDDQLDSGRRLHRKIGRLLAFEDAIDIAGRTTILVEIVRPVRDQAAIGGFVTVRVDRGQLWPGR